MPMDKPLHPTDPEPFWKSVMHAFNKIAVKLTISGRRGKQNYSIDDDKCAFEIILR